jgi:hypothetical protein
MLEVADIVRLHGDAFRTRFGDRLLPSQKRALTDIRDCRTARFGGHVKQCDHCGGEIYAYHSCRNRHCPKCHGDQTRHWLDGRGGLMLPCSFYLVTFTLPAELRALAFANQRKVYGMLMRCAAAALQKMADDPRWLGARLGCLAVLHTWTRALLYHPHVHLLVTCGGLPSDGSRWLRPKNPAFLVPVRALSLVFRAKMCAALKKAGLLEHAPVKVWSKKWVVHCRPAGSGEKALQYLGRYVFRVALANSRLERIEAGRVTFRYRDSRTSRMRRVTLQADEFLRRFLQHALPKGCVKVRYYGIWSPSCRRLLDRARNLLEAPPPTAANPDSAKLPAAPAPERCPLCRVGFLAIVETLRPRRRFPP